MMWKSKIKPATFPAIPEGMHTTQLPNYINKWLFDTGYLNSGYYRATYGQCEEPSEDKVRAMLGEIFCN